MITSDLYKEISSHNPTITFFFWKIRSKGVLHQGDQICDLCHHWNQTLQEKIQILRTAYSTRMVWHSHPCFFVANCWKLIVGRLEPQKWRFGSDFCPVNPSICRWYEHVSFDPTTLTTASTRRQGTFHLQPGWAIQVWPNSRANVLSGSKIRRGNAGMERPNPLRIDGFGCGYFSDPCVWDTSS